MTSERAVGEYPCRWCHQPVHSTGLYWVDAKGRYECPKRYASSHKPTPQRELEPTR